jgi:peptidoglycan/xylan/chitin deacetylase (PgdA/CDA1 family)
MKIQISVLLLMIGFAPLSMAASNGARANGLADLPPLSTAGVPRPSGAAGGLKVLDWAGFSSAVTYTFDDSLPSQLANYARLHATGVRMTFFEVSGVGYNRGWQQAVDDGNELGNHTAHHCHSDGSGCGFGFQTWVGSIAQEYDECNRFLEESYGVSNVWDTASPYGDTGYDGTAATRFFLNRGVQGGQITPDDSTDAYNLLSYVAQAGETASVFDALIDSARSAHKWQIFLFHSLGGDGGYAPVNPAEVISSINHAKSLGDVWVDDQVNIGTYWAGQKAIANGTTKHSGKKIVISWTLPAHFPPGRHVRVTVTGGTVKQRGVVVPWNRAGYYEVALDPGSLTIVP